MPVQPAQRAVPVRALWLGVALLLAFWLTRLAGISRFPFFIDEGLHVAFSEATMQHHPFIYAGKYYLFSLWWWSLLGAPLAASVWVSRVATLLAVLPGFAAAFATGRLFAGVWGALLAGLLYLFSAYHFFFERLAMADPISAAAVMLALCFAARLARRVRQWDATLTGLAVFLAIGAKLSALPYLGIPLAAALALHPAGSPARRRFRWLAAALAVEGALVALFAVALLVTGHDPFANAFAHVGLNRGGLADTLARVPVSAGYMLENLHGWLGAGGLVVVALALVYLLLRRQFFLLLCLFAPALVFLLSAMQGSRYYAAPMSVLLLSVAVALADATRRSRILQAGALVLIGVWAAAVWLPFARSMNDGSAHINLPPHDFREYVASDASGFGLDEARAVLRRQGARRVIGALANCQSLRYLSAADFAVDCPPINPNGDSIPELAALMDASRAGGVYVVLEAIAYLPETAPGALVTAIDHPSGRPRLSIYNLAP